ARMREQAGAIRRELSMLGKDVERMLERVSNLDRHFGLAQDDVRKIRISAEKAGTRAERLEGFDFGDGPEELAPPVVPALEGEG
ncbi:MAG TPA: DNA recombination protein RmuC, partial [Thermohalobaculum sp.]|nr:DNA recombination protein RmuC [Thermohalobaculum sp.]